MMITSLGALVRGMLLVLALACGVAVFVARLVPPPAGFRLWQDARHAAINGAFFGPTHGPTEVLNTETGRLDALALADGDALQWAAFSDWVDELGDSQLVGRWTARSGKGGALICEGVGLARFSFPSGRPLNRVRMENAPVSMPCWYPGSTTRVLFAAGDGHLYHYTFDDADEQGSPTEGTAEPILWPKLPGGACDAVIEDPVWPRDPRYGGRLFVAISFVAKRQKGGALPYELWWLKLNAAGTEVADAGRVATDRLDGPPRTATAPDERFPRLTTTPDGGLALAYQIRQRGANKGDLRVARVDFDPRTDAPMIRHAAAHRVVEGCAATPAAFTPDGGGLFALLGSPLGPWELQHFTFADALPPPSALSLAVRSPARRSLTYRAPLVSGAGRPG